MPTDNINVTDEITHQQSEQSNHRNEDVWGDKMRIKDDKTIRICFQNINGIPVDNNNHKNKAIFDFLKEKEVDTIGFSEVNVAWKKSQ